MYNHAARLQAQGVTVKRDAGSESRNNDNNNHNNDNRIRGDRGGGGHDHLGKDRLALLQQTLVSGADPDFTCRLTPVVDSSDDDDGDEVKLGDVVDDGVESAAITVSAAAYSALHVACAEGLHDAVSTLLNFKANAFARNDAGLTPIHLAAMYGRGKCIDKLLRHCSSDNNVTAGDGGDGGGGGGGSGSGSGSNSDGGVHMLVNARTWMGETPLFYAVQQGFAEAADALLAARADVNAARTDGCTPLMIAVSEKDERLVDVLLASSSIDVGRTSDSGWTALNLADDDAGLQSKLQAAIDKGATSGATSGHKATTATVKLPVQHLQVGWRVEVCLASQAMSPALSAPPQRQRSSQHPSTSWMHAVVVSSDPLGNFGVELSVANGNAASGAGLTAGSFLPASVANATFGRRHRIVPGDLMHVHLFLQPGDWVRCNPNTELRPPSVGAGTGGGGGGGSGGGLGADTGSSLGSTGGNVRSWLPGVVLACHWKPAGSTRRGGAKKATDEQQQAGGAAPASPPAYDVPRLDIAVTEGPNRGLVLRDVPATAWNVHPRLVDGASQARGTMVEVCVDGRDMWVPLAADDPESARVIAAAAPSHVRRAFSGGDQVVICASGHSNAHGVVVGRSSTNDSNVSADIGEGSGNSGDNVDVLVGGMEPLVAFAGFNGQRVPVPSRRVRSLPRSSLFHGHPRFGNGLTVVVSPGRRDSGSGRPSPITSPRQALGGRASSRPTSAASRFSTPLDSQLVDSGEVFVVDHEYEDLDAYEIVSAGDHSVHARAHVDDLCILLRRGEQLMAYIQGAWVHCIVAETARLSHLSASSSHVKVFPQHTRGSVAGGGGGGGGGCGWTARRQTGTTSHQNQAKQSMKATQHEITHLAGAVSALSPQSLLVDVELSKHTATVLCQRFGECERRERRSVPQRPVFGAGNGRQPRQALRGDVSGEVIVFVPGEHASHELSPKRRQTLAETLVKLLVCGRQLVCLLYTSPSPRDRG